MDTHIYMCVCTYTYLTGRKVCDVNRKGVIINFFFTVLSQIKMLEYRDVLGSQDIIILKNYSLSYSVKSIFNHVAEIKQVSKNLTFCNLKSIKIFKS